MSEDIFVYSTNYTFCTYNDAKSCTEEKVMVLQEQDILKKRNYILELIKSVHADKWSILQYFMQEYYYSPTH